MPWARSPASAMIAARGTRWSSASYHWLSPSYSGTSSSPAQPVMQFQERHTWIPSLNVEYHLGVDGLGLLMLLLSAIVVPMAIAASWRDQGARPSLLRSGTLAAGGPLRHLHRAEFLSLVHLLGTQPHPRLLPDHALGRPAARPRLRHSFLSTPWSAASPAALLPRHLHLATGTFDFIELAALAQ